MNLSLFAPKLAVVLQLQVGDAVYKSKDISLTGSHNILDFAFPTSRLKFIGDQHAKELANDKLSIEMYY